MNWENGNESSLSSTNYKSILSKYRAGGPCPDGISIVYGQGPPAPYYKKLQPMNTNSKLFTPATIGPLTLRNRTIRAAAFESMCPGNAPSEMLYNYHKSVAAGGIGMTTLAYAAVTRSGLSFDRQLWMREEIIPGLRAITDAIHKEGAAASVQLGHCGNMSHKSICGCTPISASSGFNIYSPTIVRGMKQSEIMAMSKAFGDAVRLAREAGMDAVEIHAGHGYLISQFLSPYTNHRKDRLVARRSEDGGTFHDTHRTIQGSLFPGRCPEIPCRPENASGIRRRFGIPRKDRRSIKRRIRICQYGTCPVE